MEMDYDRIGLFHSLPAETLAEVLVVLNYQTGDQIFTQGDPTTGLWCVMAGKVAMERVADDGTLATTGVWIEGDMVGIAGLWDQSEYPASARALSSPTTIGWIRRLTVLRLHQEIPLFGLEISRQLAERLRYIQESISSRQGRPMVQQVASVVLTLSARMGNTIVLTHEDLAHIIGTHRETVSRALRELTRDGVVNSRHGIIEVVDGDRLKDWIGVER